MTDTIKTPTDAEIGDLWHSGFQLRPLSFARAVLARWGAAPVGEPVGPIETCAVCGDGKASLVVMRHCDVCGSDYAGQTESEVNLALERSRRAPKPEAAPREPLTVAEVEQILAQWVYEIHGDRARYIVRKTEAAHGIAHKEGGQDAE